MMRDINLKRLAIMQQLTIRTSETFWLYVYGWDLEPQAQKGKK
jgi:hypothetical protein